MTSLLHDYVTRQAERRAEAVALVMDDERMTYGELEEDSNRMAALFIELGCRDGDRVCLMLSKSPRAITSMIAALKAGCAYVPIDVTSPAARVEKVLRAVEPRLIVVDESGVALLDEIVGLGAVPTDLVVVAADDDPLAGRHFAAAAGASAWKVLDAGPVSVPRSSDTPAHLLFTSGSTGVPKGVVITHANVSSFVEWATAFFEMAPTDRISGHPPLHFDLSTFDVYATLYVGAELHLVPPRRNLLPSALADFIRSSRLQQWFAVPSVFSLMAALDVVGEPDFPSLERVLWCGEVLPTRVLRYWMERVPHATFTNLYGPTETTIASSYHTVRRVPESDAEPIPIGVACEGEELLVLDERMIPVAPGDIGEVYIGGVGVSPGYWRDPEQTGRAFVTDPRSADPSVRIYRTGDRGQRGHDGLVYFVGRTDSQIKHRGYRVELGEIEAAVSALEGVRECAVVATETDGFASTTICCAYVTDDLGDRVREMRDALRSSLPQYMLPTDWLALDALPKNRNGKIDRPHLRAMFERARTRTAKPAAVRSGVARRKVKASE